MKTLIGNGFEIVLQPFCGGQVSWDRQGNRVVVTQDFWISKHTVPVGAFYDLLGFRPAKSSTDSQQPVVSSTWYEAMMLCYELERSLEETFESGSVGCQLPTCAQLTLASEMGLELSGSEWCLDSPGDFMGRDGVELEVLKDTVTAAAWTLGKNEDGLYRSYLPKSRRYENVAFRICFSRDPLSDSRKNKVRVVH